MRRLHGVVIATLLLLVVVRLLAPALRADNFGIVADADRGGWSSDFAAVLNFADAFWAGNARYDVESYLRVTRDRVGWAVEHALPFPYSPTMLWILGPFCLPSAAWSYVLWTLLGVTAAWWMTRPPQSIWLVAVFFTPTAFTCLKLGQTGILTTAGLLFLMRRDLDPRASSSLRDAPSEWLDAVVLWGLTAKPPIALTAGAALVIGRRWRVIALATGLTLLSTVLLTPLLGVHWVQGYVQLMTHYDLETADPVYVWSLVPRNMGNLRALLHVTFGMVDSAASSVSSGLWLIALVGIVVAGLRGTLGVAVSWALAVLVYLVLCPHVSSTEDVQLAVPLTLFLNTHRSVASSVRWAAVALVLADLCLAPGFAYGGPLRIPCVFAAKVLLVGLVAALCVRSSPVERRDSIAAG